MQNKPEAGEEVKEKPQTCSLKQMGDRDKEKTRALSKEKRYWSQRIENDGSSTTQLWRSLSKLLERETKSASSEETLEAESFANFFQTKVEKIKASLENDPRPTSY